VSLELHIALPFAPDSFSFVSMDLFPDSTRDLHGRMQWQWNGYNSEWEYSRRGFGVEYGERPTVGVYNDEDRHVAPLEGGKSLHEIGRAFGKDHGSIQFM
jgi:hypothetical protein